MANGRASNSWPPIDPVDGQYARPPIPDDGRLASLDIESLHASDEAAAIERILDDVAESTASDIAESAASDIADGILAALQQRLHAAFLCGGDRAWCEVYRLIDIVVAGCGPRSTPAIERLRGFLAENRDLAERVSGEPPGWAE